MNDQSIELTGEMEFLTDLPFNVCFQDKDGEEIGSLFYNDEGQLSFKGKADDSAQVFFEKIIALNNGEVKKLGTALEEAIKEVADLQAFIETIDHQYDAMQQIKSWCQAYPIDSFPAPDWIEVKEKLGSVLLSRVSASNMRHVVDGITEIITKCEKISTECGKT